MPVDEGHPLRPINSYALAKVAAEQAADYFVQKFGLEILSFRFMGVRTPSEIAVDIERMAQDPASGAWLLWTRTDARDAARACRLALEAANPPAGPYNITGAEVILSRPAAQLVREIFGSATKLGELSGQASPLSCARAHAAFSYQPQFVWNQHQQHLEA